jgi:hypothetical protein
MPTAPQKQPATVRVASLVATLLIASHVSVALSQPVGADDPVRINTVAGVIDVHIESAKLPVSRRDIIQWTQTAARAVSTYLGSYPVPKVDIYVREDDDTSDISGVEFNGTRIVVGLSPDLTPARLADGWVMTHEMFHLALPMLPDDAKWASEGLSDYLEPIARAGIGTLPPERVWGEFARDMPQGLPQALPAPGDQGLDNTHTWARTYWGGTIFWLMADVQIRQQTAGKKSLADALHAILLAGGNGTADWPLQRVLDVGDSATGTHVLNELHNEYGPRPAVPDLARLWKELGVIPHHGMATFDDHAPLAAIRLAITQPTAPRH